MITVSQDFKDAIYARSRKIKARVTVKLDNDLVFEDKLIKIDILEEMTVISDRIPSNEIKFTVDNSDKAFDILNPKGQYSIFSEDQVVIPEVELEIEDGSFESIQMGKYYLKEWKSNEGTLTTTFTARDILDVIRKYNYMFSGLTDTNLYDVTVEVLESANVTDYEVDQKLMLISTKGYLPIADYRGTLQTIAIIGKCAVYSDRTGKLIVRQFETMDQASNYVNYCGGDMYCGAIYYPMVDKEYDLKNINYDNIYAEPKIELDKEIKTVDITVNEYEPSDEIEILNTTISIIGEKQITLEYKDAPFVDVTIQVLNCESFIVLKNGANACLLNITAAGDVTINVNGKKVKNVKKVYRMNDPNLTEGTTVEVDNTLINDVETARNVAEWILREGKYRANYNVNWRQNHALECGDVVLVEDGFNAKKESRIIKQEFTYQGYLNGKTQTRGGL